MDIYQQRVLARQTNSESLAESIGTVILVGILLVVFAVGFIAIS